MMSRISSLLLLALALCALLPFVAARSHVHSHHRAAAKLHPTPVPSSVGPSEAATVRAMQQWRALKAEEAQQHEQRLATPLQWKYGMNSYTLTRPEGERSYYVYVPNSYQQDGSKPVSLVQALHGLGDDALNFADGTNMTAQAEVFGFILSLPQGSQGAIGTAWNAGTCCVLEIDDIGFLSAVLASVLNTFAIRSNGSDSSVHSMGFSNGAFMSERLGCQLSSVFTSVASVSGATILEPGNAEGLAACDAAYKSPASILHVHGNLDFVVPWNGDVILGFPSVPDNMAGWVKRNRCNPTPVQTFNISTFSNQVWSGCANGNTTVELVLNNGGGHMYPAAVPQDPTSFDATNYLLAFWNRVTPGGL